MIEFTDKQLANSKFAANFNSKFDFDNKYSELMTCEGFICFKPYIAEKREAKKGDDMYEMSIAIPADDPATIAMIKTISEFRVNKFGKKRGLKMPIKDGTKYVDKKLETTEEEGGDQEELDKIEKNYGKLRGMKFFTAKTKFDLNQPGKKPQLLDWDLIPCEGADLEGSAIVRIKVCPYGFTNPENSGVSLGLRSIQLLQKGEAFGGDHDSASDFGKVENPKEEKSSASDFSEDDEGYDEEEEAPAPKKKAPAKKKPVAKKPVETEDEPEYDDEEEEDDDAEEVALAAKKKAAAAKKKKAAAAAKKKAEEEEEEEDEFDELSDDETFDELD